MGNYAVCPECVERLKGDTCPICNTRYMTRGGRMQGPVQLGQFAEQSWWLKQLVPIVNEIHRDLEEIIQVLKARKLPAPQTEKLIAFDSEPKPKNPKTLVAKAVAAAEKKGDGE